MNIGIDLGTSSVIVYVDGKGIVLSEASVTASESNSGKVISIGSKAYKMIGRNPSSISVTRPLKNGVISDFTATQCILRYYLQKVCGNRIFKPNIVICMPSSITGLEKRTLLDLATSSGAGRACLIEEPLAAAFGAGVEYNNHKGIMVVDIGGGTTDIAVITMGSISVSKSIYVAGNAFDDAIMRYVKRERDMIIGEITAEEIKKKIGCAYMRDAEIAIQVKGKNYISGMPEYFEITTTEVFLALREQLEKIAEGIRSVLEITPPELSSDIAESGIILTGGGSLLRGLDGFIFKKTGIKTVTAHDPVNCVARGIGTALGHIDILAENGYLFKTREDITGRNEDVTSELESFIISDT
ncbi:MAG: rod shape-determining protein [Clostridiales bacterium]|nr:rod shape-determining protein [Clostridiales bacterium]